MSTATALGRAPSVDRRFFQATADALHLQGLDLDQICAAQGLVNPLLLPGERLPLDAVSHAYEAVARVAPDPAFVYLEPAQVAHEQSSVLFTLVPSCASPADMVRAICRYATIASDAVRFELRDDGPHMTVRLTPAPRVAVSRQQVELAVWFLVQWLRRLHALTPLRLDCRVQFAHAALFAPARYAALYQLPLAFGQPHTEVCFGGEALRLALPGHDARRQVYLQTQAERYEQAVLADGDVPRRAAILLMQRLAFGQPDAAEIAAQLHMSVRTLQRRLHEEGSSWGRVADEARRQVACQELRQTARPVSEIAMLTGFSDTRAFLRAFRRWTGLTPTQYRQEVDANADGDKPVAGDPIRTRPPG